MTHDFLVESLFEKRVADADEFAEQSARFRAHIYGYIVHRVADSTECVVDQS